MTDTTHQLPNLRYVLILQQLQLGATYTTLLYS